MKVGEIVEYLKHHIPIIIKYEDGNRPNNVKINNKMEELLIDKINEIIDYINGGSNGE